jgi:hypothetical protein
MDAYVVRIWRPGRGGASPDLRGTAVHLATGRDVTFTEPETLIRFLAGAAFGTTESAPARPSVAGDQLQDSTDESTQGGPA